MKKIFIGLLLFCFTVLVFSQQKSTVVTRTVEKNKRPNQKATYNYLLLDAVRNSDNAYAEFETLVQAVWDEVSNADISQAATMARSKVDEDRGNVTKARVYVGGNDYQAAVLGYLDALKAKITALEKYGVLGADANSDYELYKRASVAFTDISNQAIIKRNEIKEKKAIYERTFYVEK